MRGSLFSGLRVLALLLALCFCTCRAFAGIQLDDGAEVTDLAWTNDEKRLALIDRDKTLLVVDCSPAQLLWRTPIPRLRRNGVDPNTGFASTVFNQLLWSADNRQLTLVAVSPNGNLSLQQFDGSTGKTLGLVSFPIPNRKKSKIPADEVTHLWGSLEQWNGHQYPALLYESFADDNGRTLFLVDLERKKVFAHFSHIWLYRFIGSKVVLWTERGLRLWSLEHPKKSPALLNVKREYGRVTAYAVAAQNRLYVLQRKEFSYEPAHLTCYSCATTVPRVLWHQPLALGMQPQFGADEILPSDNGWAAVSIIHGTDGTSAPEVWCVSQRYALSQARLFDTQMHDRKLYGKDANSFNYYLWPTEWRSQKLLLDGVVTSMHDGLQTSERSVWLEFDAQRRTVRLLKQPKWESETDDSNSWPFPKSERVVKIVKTGNKRTLEFVSSDF